MIKKLQEEGNEIILITARDYEEFSSPYELTKQFLKDNNKNKQNYKSRKTLFYCEK
jgi:hypothetical protein